MANPNVNWDDIISTTLSNRSKKLSDNVTNNNALLKRLEAKGKRRTVDGGTKIVQELEYGENTNFLWYSGYDTLLTAVQQTFSAAEFDWKQCAVAITMSGLEELQNSGSERMIDLMEARINNAEKTMRNRMAAAIYGDGTAASGKAIGGLGLLVSDTGVGVAGGIDSTTWTFWKNQAFDATTDGGAPASATNMLAYMNAMWLKLVRGTDRPDLLVADNAYYTAYWSALLPQQRFTSPDMAQAGFESLKYMSSDVVFDGGMGGACPANHMYFLGAANDNSVSLAA